MSTSATSPTTGTRGSTARAGAGDRVGPAHRAADAALDVVPEVPESAPVFATRAHAGTPFLTRGPQAPPRARTDVDWVGWAVTSGLLVAFFVLVVSGRVVTEGPVVLVLTATHGVHLGDLFALAATSLGIVVPVLRGFRRG